MRVLICSMNYAPELTGVGKFSGELGSWLVDRGHEVLVVAAPPYYPKWRVDAPYSQMQYQKERVSGATVWRCPVWVPRRPRGLTRVAHLLSFGISSSVVLIGAAAWRPKVIITIEPTVATAPAALIASKLSGAKLWLHVQDLELEVAASLGLLRVKVLQRALKAAHTAFLNAVDGLSTISERMRSRLSEEVRPGRLVEVFPNWVCTATIKPLESVSTYRNALGIPSGTTVLMYSGNFGEKQGVEVLVGLARYLKSRADVVFVFAGAGVQYDAMRVSASDVSNIHWLKLQPVEQLREFLGLADIHLLPQRAEAELFVMPSKLSGMLASGRPVIAMASDQSDVRHALGDAGVVVNPRDFNALSDAVVRLVEDRELREEMGRRAWNRANELFRKEKVLGAWEQCLERLLTPGQPSVRDRFGQ